MKIKVFKFEVSNFTSTMEMKEIQERPFRVNAYARIATPQNIEDTINEFIADKDVVDIKTNKIETMFHNNGCGNTIHLIYTILYK